MYTPRRKMISLYFAAPAAKLYEVFDKLTPQELLRRYFYAWPGESRVKPWMSPRSR